MLDHISLGSHDLNKAGDFYTHVLGVLGYRLHKRTDQELAFGPDEAWTFFLYPAVQEQAVVGARMHIAICAPDRSSALAFHAEAIARGAEAVKEVAHRPEFGPDYFGGDVSRPRWSHDRDPDQGVDEDPRRVSVRGDRVRPWGGESQQRVAIVQYLCLVYGEEAVLHAMTQQASDDLTKRSLEYDRSLARTGNLIVAQALMPVHTGKTVRVRNDKVTTTDGPFAETKEQLLGLVMIEANDEAQAIEIASGIPLAKIGSIEVRAIMHLS